jgi:formate/nitrite transporter FocA (FNT family)
MIKDYIKTFSLAISAGICIGIGGTVYLMCTSKLLGAALFSVGLLTILVFKLKLFTGMTGYLLENKPNYLLHLLVTWIGNFIGTTLTSRLVLSTRLSNSLIASVNDIVLTKLNDSWYSLIILGIFCGMLMFIGVDSFKKLQEKNNFGSILIPIICVATFILAGFEHCIADMFYFAVAGFSWYSLLSLLFITLGNIVGSLIIPVIKIEHKQEIKNDKSTS